MPRSVKPCGHSQTHRQPAVQGLRICSFFRPTVPMSIAFAKLKAFLRTVRPRTFDQIVELGPSRSVCSRSTRARISCGTAATEVSLHVVKTL
jgi:hypothetical protein